MRGFGDTVLSGASSLSARLLGGVCENFNKRHGRGWRRPDRVQVHLASQPAICRRCRCAQLFPPGSSRHSRSLLNFVYRVYKNKRVGWERAPYAAHHMRRRVNNGVTRGTGTSFSRISLYFSLFLSLGTREDERRRGCETERKCA